MTSVAVNLLLQPNVPVALDNVPHDRLQVPQLLLLLPVLLLVKRPHKLVPGLPVHVLDPPFCKKKTMKQDENLAKKFEGCFSNILW